MRRRPLRRPATEFHMEDFDGLIIARSFPLQRVAGAFPARWPASTGTEQGAPPLATAAARVVNRLLYWPYNSTRAGTSLTSSVAVRPPATTVVPEITSSRNPGI